MSRGLAATRIAVAAALVLAAFLVVRSCFPTRLERLQRFLDASRDAVIERREEDFFAAIDPAVRYQGAGGVAEMRRDWARFQASGIGRATIVAQEIALDDDGADVKLDVVLSAGLRPLGQVAVKLRLADRDGAWQATELTWR